MKPALLTVLRLKWWVLALYWLVLFVVAYVVAGAWFAMSGHVDWKEGNYFGFDGLRYSFWDVLTSRNYALFMGICAAAFMLLQILILLPARYPQKAAKGVSVWFAIIGAAFLAAVLVVAYLLVVLEVLEAFSVLDDLAVYSWWGLALLLALHWAIMTPLVWLFVRRGDRESVCRRLSKALFIGSVIDVMAMVPLDVMIRGKGSCYSWSTSVFGLGAAVAVGVLALGPAIWLPLTARRRRRWFEEHCSVCGYEMIAGGERCPECGTRWRALETSFEQPAIPDKLGKESEASASQTEAQP
jgi:hypothetical protein